MKTINYIIFLSIALITFLCTSCEYDNYDEPSLLLSGKFMYNGQTFYTDGNQDRGMLKVVQKGFGKVDGGTVLKNDESGSFQQILFAGEYWLTPYNNQYPFEFKDFKSFGSGLGYDSIYINLTSNLEKNIEVTPYYTIKNFTTTVENGNIVMKFDVEKTTGTKNSAPKMVRARAYANTATLVNSRAICNTVKDILISNNGHVELAISIADGNDSYRKKYINNFRTYAFCRVAIELENIPNYYLFSETKKIEGLPL